MNAYEGMEYIRELLGESSSQSDPHWSQTLIARTMEMKQKIWAMKLMNSRGDWLMTSGSVSFSSGEATLPTDCAKPAYMEDANGYQVPIRWGIREHGQTKISQTNLYQGGLTAFVYGNKLKTNKTSYSGSCTLYYQQRPYPIVFGTGSYGTTGGGGTETFVATSPAINPTRTLVGSNIEVENDDGFYEVSTVTAYTLGASGYTITTDWVGSIAVTPKYGAVSILPEELWQGVLNESTLLLFAKPAGVIQNDMIQYLRELVRTDRAALEDWCSTRYSALGQVREV